MNIVLQVFLILAARAARQYRASNSYCVDIRNYDLEIRNDSDIILGGAFGSSWYESVIWLDDVEEDTKLFYKIQYWDSNWLGIQDWYDLSDDYVDFCQNRFCQEGNSEGGSLVRFTRELLGISEKCFEKEGIKKTNSHIFDEENSCREMSFDKFEKGKKHRIFLNLYHYEYTLLDGQFYIPPK